MGSPTAVFRLDDSSTAAIYKASESAVPDQKAEVNSLLRATRSVTRTGQGTVCRDAHLPVPNLSPLVAEN
eukprot:scaffold1328_cov394-Prasinococcus_capsulatus_cf.AAC.14